MFKNKDIYVSRELSSSHAWSNYWSKGFLTTFADEGASYSGKVKIFWQEVFSSLVSRTKLVDLGAGNGALLKIAEAICSENEIQIDMVAVDSANIIESDFYKLHPDIKLLSNTLIEKTEIDSHSVDVCISHFGFEYAPRNAAVNELQRVLKPGGSFYAILHHAESRISLQSKSIIEQIKLCERSKLVETVEALLSRLQKLKESNCDPKIDNKASELREYFNRMAERLIQYGNRLPDNTHIEYFISELTNLFGSKVKNMTFLEKINIVSELKLESESYLIRSLSMIQSSLTSEDMKKFSSLLNDNGISIKNVEELYQGESLFGWCLIASKIA